MTDDFHFYLLRRADDYVTAIRPTADIDRFGFPAWHGWAISKAWRDGYAAAINEGGQAPCESTDGCTRAQVTWEQAISHAGTDHEMAAQPVPPSPDDTKRATVLPPLDDSESIDSWLIRHADFVPQKYWGPIRVLGDAIAALRAELVAESLEVTAWRTRATKAEIERDALLLRIPNVSKVEAECRTLEDWKLRAMHMEFGWSSCSRCAAQLQGRAESAEAERDALRADAERYRHIRPMFRAFSAHVDGMHSWCATGELARMKGPTFDAAIDAARRKA